MPNSRRRRKWKWFRLERVFGWFTCSNKKCDHQWSSSHVYCVYGEYTIPFKQGCIRCKTMSFPYKTTYLRCSVCDEESWVCECLGNEEEQATYTTGTEDIRKDTKMNTEIEGEKEEQTTTNRDIGERKEKRTTADSEIQEGKEKQTTADRETGEEKEKQTTADRETEKGKEEQTIADRENGEGKANQTTADNENEEEKSKRTTNKRKTGEKDTHGGARDVATLGMKVVNQCMPSYYSRGIPHQRNLCGKCRIGYYCREGKQDRPFTVYIREGAI